MEFYQIKVGRKKIKKNPGYGIRYYEDVFFRQFDLDLN